MITYSHHRYILDKRAVRESDYSPATVLSEKKDKLIPENWRDREKNIKGFYQNHTHIIPLSKHLQSLKTTEGKLQEELHPQGTYCLYTLLAFHVKKRD